MTSLLIERDGDPSCVENIFSQIDSSRVLLDTTFEHFGANRKA
jgi:hypothetical protein